MQWRYSVLHNREGGREGRGRERVRKRERGREGERERGRDKERETGRVRAD